MSKENKKIQLKDEELENITGGVDPIVGSLSFIRVEKYDIPHNLNYYCDSPELSQSSKVVLYYDTLSGPTYYNVDVSINDSFVSIFSFFAKYGGHCDTIGEFIALFPYHVSA